MKTALPSGWAWARLGTVLTRKRDLINPSDFPDREFTSIGLEDIGSGGTGEVSTRLVAGAELASSKTQFERGDLLYGRLRPYLNKVVIAPSHGVSSTETWVLNPAPIIDREFAFWMLTSRYMLKQMERVTEGANLPRVDADGFDRVEIPTPPLSEQRRIVEILNAARDIRRLRQQADDLTTQLIPAIFNEMFGDPLSNNRNWPVASLTKLGTLDRGRSRHRPRDEPSLYGGPYPFIQTGDIANSNGWISDFSQTYSEQGLAQSRLWPAGTMCITIAANIGATAILSFDACFPDSVVGFTPNDDVVAEYVKWTFDVLRARNEARAHAGAQKNINLKFLNALQIGLPPKELQIEFRRRVQAIREIHKAHSEDSAKGLRSLTSSLLANAFSGELTAGWRSKNQKQLSHEAAERDQWLRENGVKLTTTDQSIRRKPDLTDGLAWELNSDQETLLEQIRKLGRNDNDGLFTVSTLKLDIPLDKLTPDTVRRHLDVLAARGLILAVSRRAESDESVKFGNVYRLPTGDEEMVKTGEQPDHARLSELGRLSRLARTQNPSASGSFKLSGSAEVSVTSAEGDD